MTMIPVDYMAVADDCMKRIKAGAFLTVQAGDALNTMTIGWATIGFVWGAPIFMIAVRPTRFTFGIIEQTDFFTVSIPSEGTLKEALAFCGAKSGRDYNKFEQCGLTLMRAEEIKTPLIQCNGTHYECHIVQKTIVNPSTLSQELAVIYPNKDYHTLYFGRILACYEIG